MPLLYVNFAWADVAVVSFVGSTPIAKYVHGRATANGKRVQALGGAKNHAVVLPDADMGFAAEQLAAAAFGSAGERCMAISAAVAVGSGADQLMELVDERARAVRVGPGRDATSEMGPIITPDSRDRIVGLIAAGEAQGAQVRVDGRGLVVPGHEDGFFVGPTVLDQVSTSMDVYTNEIFGPVLSVVRADDVDAASGTGRLAQHAGHAPWRVVFPLHEPVHGAVPGSDRSSLLRILDRDGSGDGRRPAEQAEEMATHVHEEVAGGQAQAAEHLRKIGLLPEGQLSSLHHDGHGPVSVR